MDSSSCPQYSGPLEMLPNGTPVIPYLQSTEIRKWSLEDFLCSSSSHEDTFLNALLFISRYKKVEPRVRAFALQLREYYSGPFGERRMKVIRQRVKARFNRHVIRGQEHLINQDELEEELDQQLSSKPSWYRPIPCVLIATSDQVASGSTTPTSEISSSFPWPSEPRHDDEVCASEGILSTTPPAIESEIEESEDLSESRVATSVNTTSSLGIKKKARASYTTEDPWRSLVSSLIKLINGESDVTFPMALPCMSPNHTQLFEHAVDSLKKFQAQEIKNRDITLLKDAQVAMSCVLNTMSANVQDFLVESQHQQLLDQAYSLSVIEGFDNHPSIAIAQEYVECLVKHGVDGLRRQLIIDRGILNSRFVDSRILPDEANLRDKVLEILTILCKFVQRPPFNCESPSENDCLHLWTSVFDVIIDKVSIHTGETMLEASKIMRQMQSLEHGDASDTGRKVDCIFMFQGVELSNIEFKRADCGARDLAIQNRKNVRLARCLQEYHASIGVKDPSIFMADVHGFVGVFYQVRPMGDIAIAGKTTSDVVHLPRTAGGLKGFLESNSLAIIWNFLTSLEAQAPTINVAKEVYDLEQEKAEFARAIHRKRSSTPPTVQRKFQGHVMLTPQKKRTKPNLQQ
ncbi:hypothetical protein EMPS_09605 [Entomortierella parvispora]|uniref:Uncharacterized protein n=1 Tax=Entomortierella parvispora TaxID=205924 RepID=A0A9P3M068_9FUNG|nr:hypothetical protein EMPS_09605 [Entomortierella parvispora]